MTYILTSIFLMALVTYLPRMIPMAIFRKEIKSNYLKSVLHYIPYAVLASLTFPDIFTSTTNVSSALLGTLTALLLAYKEQSLVVVAIGSMTVAFIVQLL